ncbi:ROK family protein [Anaerolineae bacterium CFX9]|nr:ROK family protein [Anaerolineae bacterium CFX9]
MPDPLAVGVDIGGTKIALALVDSGGGIHAESRIATPVDGGVDAIAAAAAQSVRRLIDERGVKVIGVGVGVPGYVDAQAGVVIESVNLRLKDAPIAARIAAALGGSLPVQVQNDVKALAAGEMAFGAARGMRDFVVIAVGTGLGVALVQNGAIVSGSGGAAGEIGHAGIIASGRLCVCGLRGCPEAYISGVGLVNGVRAHAGDFPASPLISHAGLTGHDVLTAADAGDPLALAALADGVHAIGQVAIVCAALLNPQAIILSGGLGLALADRLIPSMRAVLRDQTLSPTHRGVQIVTSQVTSSAAGAAASIFLS